MNGRRGKKKEKKERKKKKKKRRKRRKKKVKKRKKNPRIQPSAAINMAKTVIWERISAYLFLDLLSPACLCLDLLAQRTHRAESRPWRC